MSEKERQNWAEMLLNNHTEGTTNSYKSWAAKFEDWKEWADVSVDKDVLDEFENFLSDQQQLVAFWNDFVDEHSAWNLSRIPDDGYSYNTKVKAVSAAKSYVEYVYDVVFPSQQRYKVNHIVSGEPPDFDPDYATPSEVKQVLEETKDCSYECCYPMVRTAYDAILRSAEVVRIGWDDLNMKHGTLWVDSAKGSPKRHVKLSPKTLDALSDWRSRVKEEFDDPKWLFYKFEGYRRFNRWSARNWGYHISEVHYSPGAHSLCRHSPITNRLNAGESLSEVQRRARHANLKNTIRYDQLSDNGHVPDELQ